MLGDRFLSASCAILVTIVEIGWDCIVLGLGICVWSGTPSPPVSLLITSLRGLELLHGLWSSSGTLFLVGAVSLMRGCGILEEHR